MCKRVSFFSIDPLLELKALLACLSFLLPWTYISLSAQILLDQSFLMGVHVLWESQLEYHICHNDWEEVSKLLDLVPTSILLSRNLQVSIDSLQPASTAGYNRESNDYGNYLCSLEELDLVGMDIPDVKIFRLSANIMCSIWLRLLMEEKLAKKFIFMKEYWEGTSEIIPLLARSGFIVSRYKTPVEDDNIRSSLDLKFSDGGQTSHVDTVQALHKLLVHHCAQYNLPNLLDLYLDHHQLVLDNVSLCSLQEAAVSFYKSSECYCSLYWVFLVVLYIRNFHQSPLLAIYAFLCLKVNKISMYCWLYFQFILPSFFLAKCIHLTFLM